MAKKTVMVQKSQFWLNIKEENQEKKLVIQRKSSLVDNKYVHVVDMRHKFALTLL